MDQIEITERQEVIIRQLNDPIYSVDFLKEWINREDNVFANAPAALQAMGASGFYAAVRAIEQQISMMEYVMGCSTCGYTI